MKLHQLVLIILSITFNSWADEIISYGSLPVLTKENPFNETVIGNTSQFSKQDQNSLVSTAGGKNFVGSHLVDTSNVPDVSGMDMRGRRAKTEDSLSSGKAGVGAAIAAGAALTATGIRLLPPPTTPQGIALITLGSIEFAQAASTARVNTENTSGRDILKNGTPTGKTLFMEEEIQEKIKEKINTPELQKLLSENGVNSDTFINNLASGSFKTPEEVMNALNMEVNISPDELKNAMDNAITNFSLKSFNSEEDTLRIELPDKEPVTQGSHNGVQWSHNGVQWNPNGVHSSNRTDSAFTKNDTYVKTNNYSQNKNFDMVSNKVVLNNKELNLNKELKNLFFRVRKNHNTILSQDQKYKLNLLGIKNLRSRQNIFHVSRSTYRAYWKWIKKEKASTRKPIKTAMLFR